ncbi:calcitonin gene-related peptide type 1 receptor-like [Littorina saxatilis]|uniref:calcitonin gene-related peptide type 1 receptor-like n=1 Tax=Littorina saxatilis TaxID=31220 RepID=UPI0038B5CEEB
MSQTGLLNRLEQFLINLVDEVGLSSWKIQVEGDSTTVVLRFAGPPSSQANTVHHRKKSRSQVKRYAQKTCWENGTWFSRHYHDGHNGTRQEWTDYTTCINKQRMLTSLYLALGCNTISVIFLLPALIIFLAYRSLRRQHRIRLHVNFFTALLFSNIMSIMWDFIVTHDRITDDSDSGTTPVLFSNGVGCKLLAFLRLYFKSNTYVWMFCEGFYLHRLISNAFRPPKSLVFFYGSGWGVPLFYCMLYVILRGVYANDSCWANSFGHLEWIVYCPNLLCLVINLFFLCNILRVLLTQLQTHPNEPSNFRRALKATFVLIPLFGVQLFVTIYRLPAGQAGAPEYEQFTVFVNNSQGFFVALIFCFCNGEVIAQMKRTCTRRNLLRAGTEISSRGVTMGTSLHPRDDDNEGGGAGTNGSLLHRNGGQGHRGSKSAVVNNSCASGNDGNRDGKRGSEKYSYIPMKTLTSGGGGGGGGDVRSPV